MKMPKVWEIMQSFKDSCKRRGWEISESEDWVGKDGEYHNFLLARGVCDSSFKKIVSNRKCVVCEGLAYRVVEASCTAWLFSETPSDTLVRTVVENPKLQNQVALYDLSPMLEGKDFCAALNRTGSPVFREFENFLKREIKVKLKPFTPFSSSGVSIGTCKTVELP
jgi:hypothetical protein